MSDSSQAAICPTGAWDEVRPESQGLDPKKLRKAMGRIKSISGKHGNKQTLVVRRGRIVWQGGDIDNYHTVWSVTKVFVASCLGLLVDDGKCTLETRAADVLPSLGRDYPDVTLRHFANFTSGYEQTGSDTPFEPGPPLFPPGSKFYYSWAWDQFSNLVTRVAGEPLRDLFRRRIAEPIGMNPDAWRWEDWGPVDGLAVCGGSGWYDKGIFITARELARVGWLMAAGGQWNGRRILSEAWLRESTAVQVPSDVPPYDAEKWYKRLPGACGIGWWLNTPSPAGEPIWPSAPRGACFIHGNRNNMLIVIPEWQMVVVRMGTDNRIDTGGYDDFFARMTDAITD